MRTRIDATLRDEASRYGLRFACEDCAHFVAERAACAHGYPPGPRLTAMDGVEIVFCKEFELGGG